MPCTIPRPKCCLLQAEQGQCCRHQSSPLHPEHPSAVPMTPELTSASSSLMCSISHRQPGLSSPLPCARFIRWKIQVRLSSGVPRTADALGKNIIMNILDHPNEYMLLTLHKPFISWA